MRRLIRWAFCLFFIVIVLLVAGILLLNTFVKQVVESRLRSTTGMDVTIGSIDIGLLAPTVTIENFKIYNTPEFGGSLFLNMPELHMEYDPFAIRSGKLHFKLVRLDLAEITLIQDKKGRLNVQDMAKNNPSTLHAARVPGANIKFTGIDTLNLTLGKFRLSNLGTGRAEEVDFGLTNQITHNVKSESDLAALNLILAARASMAATSTNSVLNLPSLLNILTH